jgi:hypothetical protein
VAQRQFALETKQFFSFTVRRRRASHACAMLAGRLIAPAKRYVSVKSKAAVWCGTVKILDDLALLSLSRHMKPFEQAISPTPLK